MPTEGSSRSRSPSSSRPRVPVFLISKDDENSHEPNTQYYADKTQPPVRNTQYERLLGFMSPTEPLNTELQNQTHAPPDCRSNDNTFRPKLSKFSGTFLPHYFEWSAESIMTMQRLGVPYSLWGKCVRRCLVGPAKVMVENEPDLGYSLSLIHI